MGSKLVVTRPPAFSAALLSHEQGHYDIGMLSASEFLSGLNDIQGRAFPTAHAGAAAVTNLRTRLFSAQAIHDKYDKDTGGGTIGAMQVAWNTALSNARVTFTAPALRVALGRAGLFP